MSKHAPRPRIGAVVADVIARQAEANDWRVEKAAVVAEASRLLQQAGVGDDLVVEAVQLSADKEMGRKTHEGQGDLLTGEDTVLDGFFALGDGRMVQRRHATLNEYRAHMELVHKNRKAVNDRADEEQRQFLALLPYLSEDPDMTIEVAQKRYLEDNPTAGI